jgi:hypothetical protein
MATTTYLSNPAVLTVDTVDLKDQCSSITLTYGYASLDRTAFGDSGTQMTAGLQTVEGTITFYVDYGASSVEATIAAAIGDGTTDITFRKGSGAIAADNPEFQITDTMIANAPITYSVGELQVMEVSFEGGVWVRDVTP